MSTLSQADKRREPLVAVICEVPLLFESLASALDNIADVQQFPAQAGDTVGLLRWLRPDAVVVDTQEEADEAARFAREAGLPLVFVSLRERKLRVLMNGGWVEPENGDASPETIRNILVGRLFGKERP